MADEIKEVEEITEEPVIEDGGKPDAGGADKLKVDTTDMPDSSGNKPDDGAAFVKKIMDKLPSFGGKKEVETEEKDSETETDIPDVFTSAAKEAGWTDDDITEFATDYTDEQLKEMIPFLLEEEEPEEQKGKPSATDSETPNADGKPIPKEGIEALKEELRKEFEAEIKELKEKSKVVDEAREAQHAQDMINNINQVFDEAGKEFEVFGKTEELPIFPAGPKKGQYVPNSTQMKARVAVYEKAAPFIQAGAPVKEAMDIALTWYKGKNLEADVKRNFVKDLKTKEKKLSAKRVSKETVPTYEDEDDYKAAFIRKEAEKLGIKLAED